MTNPVVEQIRNNAYRCPDLRDELAKAIAEIIRLSALVDESRYSIAQERELRAEIARLLAGNWTPEEVNGICHNLHGVVDARGFADGCAAEQRKLYGCAPDADLSAWNDAAIELPDDDLIVLVYTPGANFSEPVWLGYLDSESGVWRYVDGVSIDSHTVTHWMPLPAGPAGGAVCPHQSKKNQY